jgi:hypothetical protein
VFWYLCDDPAQFDLASELGSSNQVANRVYLSKLTKSVPEYLSSRLRSMSVTNGGTAKPFQQVWQIIGIGGTGSIVIVFFAKTPSSSRHHVKIHLTGALVSATPPTA